MSAPQSEPVQSASADSVSGEDGISTEKPAASGNDSAVLLGRELREARERLNETLADVSQSLKLSKKQLEAIESGNYAILPGPAFTRGFIRNYARHLGLDIEKLFARYEILNERVELTPISNAKGDMPVKAKKPRRKALYIWIVLILAGLAALGWYFDGFSTGEPGESSGTVMPVAPSENRSDSDTNHVLTPGFEVLDPVPPLSDASETSEPSQPDINVQSVLPIAATPIADEEVQAITADQDAQSTAMVLPSEPSLIFTLSKPCWIKVEDATSAVLHEKLETAGVRLEIKGTPPFRVVIGDPSAVTVEFAGNPIDLTRFLSTGRTARLTIQ